MKRIYYLTAVLFVTALSGLIACSNDEQNGNGEEENDPKPEETVVISVKSDGEGIENDAIIRYEAAEDISGEIIAGDDQEPLISSNRPCKLEVAISIPENDLKYIQWCGITEECMNYSESGTYSRTLENMTGEVSMAMHAHFRKGVSASCRVKVEVLANDKPERTFFIEYNYEAEDGNQDNEGDQPEEKVELSIMGNGCEIGNDQTITYMAEEDASGALVAGHDKEPVFTSNVPCRLEVSITVPDNDLQYLQWCGITEECMNYSEAGTYTRVIEKMSSPAEMALHAHFQKDRPDTCKIKVDVKVNDESERTFYLEYIYTAPNEGDGGGEEPEEPENPDQPEEPEVIKLSVLNNGMEIGNDEILTYQAENFMGRIVAGDEQEPIISTSGKCRLEVSVSLPEMGSQYIRWSGIGGSEEDLTGEGTYSRIIEETGEAVPMAMQAYFKEGSSSTFSVQVDIKVNDVLQRTFRIQYSYTAESDGDDNGGEDGEEDPDQSYAEPALRSSVVAVAFTGQRCRYCPNQGRSLAESEQKYGKDHYIITALHHLTEYSLLPEAHVSLYNQEAELYAESIDIHPGLPQLVYNTLGPTVSDLWLEDMYKEDDLLECTGEVQFSGQNDYTVNIESRLRSNRKDFIRGKQIDILIWALENDIVALQDDNGKWTYPAHQHIFRGSVNTTWGESYKIGTSYSRTLAIPEAVSVKENTEVIVFFLDHDTRTILDAAKFYPSAE